MFRGKVAALLLHGLAVGVGVAAAVLLKPQPEGAQAPARVSKTERRGGSAGELPGEALVDGFIARHKSGRKEDRNDEYQALGDRLRELIEELAPTADPRATFLELQEQVMGEFERGGPTAGNALTAGQEEEMVILAVRFAQWLEADPKDALAAQAEPGL